MCFYLAHASPIAVKQSLEKYFFLTMCSYKTNVQMYTDGILLTNYHLFLFQNEQINVWYRYNWFWNAFVIASEQRRKGARLLT